MQAQQTMYYGLGLCTGAVGAYSIMRVGNTLTTSLIALGLAFLGLGIGLYGWQKSKAVTA